MIFERVVTDGNIAKCSLNSAIYHTLVLVSRVLVSQNQTSFIYRFATLRFQTVKNKVVERKMRLLEEKVFFKIVDGLAKSCNKIIYFK